MSSSNRSFRRAPLLALFALAAGCIPPADSEGENQGTHEDAVSYASNSIFGIHSTRTPAGRRRTGWAAGAGGSG
jgi:hypothetical protein